MIEIRKREDLIIISGHAQYADVGKDIVCAGISALSLTLIESLKELTTDKVETSLEPGLITIAYENPSEKAQILIDSFFIGAEAVANEYPDHVRIM